MFRILERDIPVTVEVEVRNRIGTTVEQAANVVGEIRGTDLADEVVMIGAHFDTWHASPNASDNTSGSAVMLEAMRILKAVGARPRRTIRIALWAGEEQGLHGSREYVLKHFGDPDSPVSKLAAERGGVDLMPEMGYRPTNKYLPPRARTETGGVADAPPLEPASTEGGFLGWVDRMLSR